MKPVLRARHARPEEVVRCAEAPNVGAPGAGEVVLDVVAFPNNPADGPTCRSAGGRIA